VHDATREGNIEGRGLAGQRDDAKLTYRGEIGAAEVHHEPSKVCHETAAGQDTIRGGTTKLVTFERLNVCAYIYLFSFS